MVTSPARIIGNLASELGLAVGQDVVERQGRKIRLGYTQQRRRNQHPTLRLTIEVDVVGAAGAAGRKQLGTRPLVVLRRETGRDRLGKRLGLNREVQTGDTTFDAAVYIESDAPDADVLALVEDARVREHVAALVADGARLSLDGEGLTASYPQRSFGRDAFESAAQHLSAIADGLPLFAPGAPSPRSSPALMALGFLIWPATIAVGVALGREGTPLRTAPWVYAAGAGLGLWALLLLALIPLVRGRSDSLRRWMLLAVLLVFPLPMTSLWVLLRVNVDEAAPSVEHAVRVERVWYNTNRSGRTWYARFADWAPGSGDIDLRIRRDEAQIVHAGDTIVVTTSVGKLGWEWVRGYHFGER